MQGIYFHQALSLFSKDLKGLELVHFLNVFVICVNFNPDVCISDNILACNITVLKFKSAKELDSCLI